MHAITLKKLFLSGTPVTEGCLAGIFFYSPLDSFDVLEKWWQLSIMMPQFIQEELGLHLFLLEICLIEAGVSEALEPWKCFALLFMEVSKS